MQKNFQKSKVFFPFSIVLLVANAIIFLYQMTVDFTTPDDNSNVQN